MAFPTQSADYSFTWSGKVGLPSNGVRFEPIGARTPWYSASWGYRKAITIQHSKVSGSTDLVDFPVLYSVTDAELESTANGGLVGKADGTDILFTAADGTTKLSHELESYDAATGAVVAWVKIPALSAVNDTTIYIYFGNAAAANQQSVSSTWNSNYKAVWHLNVPSGNSVSDSTSNANTGTKTSTSVAAKIGGGQTFNTTTSINVADSASLDLTSNLTISAWGNATSFPQAYGQAIVSKEGNYQIADVSGEIAGVFWDASNNIRSLRAARPSTGAWHHIVFQVQSGDGFRLYIDGVIVDSTPQTEASSAQVLTNQLQIGTSSSDPGYNGSLDEIRISSVVLSQDWILTEYANQNTPNTFCATAIKESQAVPIPSGDGFWFDLFNSTGATNHALSGVSVGASSSQGALRLKLALAATSPGASSSTAAIGIRSQIAGSSAGTSSSTANLTIKKNLAGVSAGQSSSTAALKLRNALGATSPGQSSSTASLAVRRALVGTSTGTSSSTGSLSRRMAIAGTSSGQSSSTAALRSRLALAGASTGQSSTSGSFSGSAAKHPLNGACVGLSATTAALTVRRKLAAVATGGSQSTATLTDRIGLAGVSQGTSSTVGQLLNRISLTGVSVGTSATGGTFSVPVSGTPTILGVETQAWPQIGENVAEFAGGEYRCFYATTVNVAEMRKAA